MSGTGSAAALTVEIVNDSQVPDGDVFLLLTGTSVSVTGSITWLQLPQSSTGSVTAGALTALGTGGTMISPYTGETRTIYTFEVNSLVSGRLLISFGTPITYADNQAPTATRLNFRWDKMEFGFPNSGADLTSLDFFGIPLQFEYLDANGRILDTMTFYTGTSSFLSALYELNPSTTSAAFQQSTANGPSFGWTPAKGLGTFLRVAGPQTLTAANAGSPSPYPSFEAYLDSLVAAKQTYTVVGSAGVGAPAPPANAVSYDYSGVFSSEGRGGFALTLTGATSGAPWGLYTDANGSTTAAQLPASLPVRLVLIDGKYNNNIYSADADAFIVGQSEDSKAPNYLPPDLIKYTKNSPYASIAGDLIAGLNFGYPNGVYGTDSAAWYGNPPTPYPFGAARRINDGYYNPYAAVLYNLSDAYGFPFSDRSGRPSPYVPLPPTATTMRVTILNDERLDAPQVTIAQMNESTFTLAWPAVQPPAGFTLDGYEVAVTPPYPAWTTRCGAEDLTVTVGSLPPGTGYRFTVTAVGTANGRPVRSHPTSLTGATSGNATPLAGIFTFLTTLNWSAAAAAPASATFSINGASYTPGDTPVSVNGSAGNNIYPLTIADGSGDVIYRGSYVISLVADGDGYNLAPGGYFMLAGNSQPLSAAGPTGTPPYTSASGGQLVVGTPFAPNADKEPNPVVFPT